MYYRPKLANGKFVQNPWPIRFFRNLNQICWPLEDNAGLLAHIFDRLNFIFGFILFVEHYDAELRYFFRNIQNIDEVLSGVPTTLILFEVTLRGYQMSYVKENLKKLQKEFYAKIYIEDTENHEICENIKAKMIPTTIVSAFYFLTLFLHAVVPIMNFAKGVHEPLYKMIFVFDITPAYIYYLIIFSNLWVGVNVVSYLNGELNVFAQIILHLNGRFVMLREDLEKSSWKLLAKTNPATIASEFQSELTKIIKRNVDLYKFSAKVQAQFSYRVFVWFALSAALLCALGFKAYTSPKDSFAYLVWSTAKIVELCAIGELGSTLIKTTNEVSSMYYYSNWEHIIMRSTNTCENVRLMKLILVAMETSHKPIYLSGLNFFSVSLAAVITILQGAGSYFTCLISIR